MFKIRYVCANNVHSYVGKLVSVHSCIVELDHMMCWNMYTFGCHIRGKAVMCECCYSSFFVVYYANCGK